tara:strand:+ start:37 stop:258 length:222 start_codon:yes stop_codon:yes gene_type:complete
MAFKMKYGKHSKEAFPFKNDDDKKKTGHEGTLEEFDNEFVNDGSKQPGVTQELHDALIKDLEEKKELENKKDK